MENVPKVLQRTGSFKASVRLFGTSAILAVKATKRQRPMPSNVNIGRRDFDHTISQRKEAKITPLRDKEAFSMFLTSYLTPIHRWYQNHRIFGKINFYWVNLLTVYFIK